MAKLLLRGLPVGTIRGVLFDKDGTLSHSEPGLIKLAEARLDQAVCCFQGKQANAERIAKLRGMLAEAYGLSAEGVHPGGIIAVAARHHNLISTATVFCLLGEPWPQALALANDVFATADELENQDKPASPQPGTLLTGARQLLTSLRQTEVSCAVISNDSLSGIQRFISDNKLTNAFSQLWSADDQPAKPDPEAVKALCLKLGLRPNQCALIGDADSDLQMARDAGIGISLGFTAGWHRPTELTAHEHLIHHWDELTVVPEPKVHQN
ncbi:MAG: HAD family hydrolase [Prochlorococcus sp.]